MRGAAGSPRPPGETEETLAAPGRVASGFVHPASARPQASAAATVRGPAHSPTGCLTTHRAQPGTLPDTRQRGPG